MNIRQGGEYAGNKSEPFSDLINRYDPDVIALQEVDYKTTRNGKRDWLNEVASQTGMFPYYSKSITYQGGAFGTALLSRYPFFKAEKTIFSHKDTREDRSTAWIYVQLPCGEVVRVGTVHLSLETSQMTSSVSEVTRSCAEGASTKTLLYSSRSAKRSRQIRVLGS